MATSPQFPSLLPLGIVATRLDARHEAAVAAFCRQCSVFFTLVAGEAPATEWARQVLESRPLKVELARRHVIGLERGSALVAIVDLLEGYPDKTDWYVGLLILSPDDRAQGLGMRIWSAMEEWIRAAGGRHVRLIVQEQNPNVARFWRAVGFTDVGTVEQHFPARTNLCWRFEKHLTCASTSAGVH